MEKAGGYREDEADAVAGSNEASEPRRNTAVVGGAIGKIAGRASNQAKWTFLVYMAGDNNLDGAALRDIAEMARAGSTKDVNILVQLDRIEDKLTRRFRITQDGGFKKDCIETFSETNTGDPQILYSFVKWAADNFPADRYALILWNHGSGWWEDARSRAAGISSAQDVIPNSAALSGASAGRAQDVISRRSVPQNAAASHGRIVDSVRFVAEMSQQDPHSVRGPKPITSSIPVAAPPDNDSASTARLEDPTDLSAAQEVRRSPYRPLFRHLPSQAHRSICYDDTSGGDALDNCELKGVLSQVCALLGKKIDLLGMDACLMNMVEVAYQFRDSVNVIVGSEIEEPFDGWPYAEILTRLTARPRRDAAALARWIVKSYLLSYKRKNETVTQSAIDVSRIGDMVTKIDILSEALLAALETDAKFIEAAWNRSPRFYDENYIDLACFVKNLRKKAGGDIEAKANDLLAALKAGRGRTILCQGKIGREVQGTCGLSIYFPGDRINPAYRTLDFSGDCKWIAFLERYL